MPADKGYEINGKIKDLVPYDPVVNDGKIHLDANESFLPLPEELVSEFHRRLSAVPLNRYPDPGARGLCAAFARCYGVEEAHVVAGNGSDELISLLFLGFLEKGDAFATLEPDFSMYAVNGHLNEMRHVPLQKGEGFTISPGQVVEQCNREGVKLLIFSNPCNPTSVVLPVEAVQEIVEGVHALVVLDEAYMDFSDQSLLSQVTQYDNLLILRTCSKAFGLAGARLGFAVGNPVLIQALRGVKAPYNVNVLSQLLGEVVLENRARLAQGVETVKASAAQLRKGFEALAQQGTDLQVVPGETNFVALVVPRPEALLRYLDAQCIVVRYTGGVVRITCGTPLENEGVLEAVRAYFEKGEN